MRQRRRMVYLSRKYRWDDMNDVHKGCKYGSRWVWHSSSCPVLFPFMMMHDRNDSMVMEFTEIWMGISAVKQVHSTSLHMRHYIYEGKSSSTS